MPPFRVAVLSHYFGVLILLQLDRVLVEIEESFTASQES